MAGAGLHALLLFCARFLMMNLSGVKDNRVVHVLNISGVLASSPERPRSRARLGNEAGRKASELR